jgi:hypothetical protein
MYICIYFHAYKTCQTPYREPDSHKSTFCFMVCGCGNHLANNYVSTHMYRKNIMLTYSAPKGAHFLYTVMDMSPLLVLHSTTTSSSSGGLACSGGLNIGIGDRSGSGAVAGAVASDFSVVADCVAVLDAVVLVCSVARFSLRSLTIRLCEFDHMYELVSMHASL